MKLAGFALLLSGCVVNGKSYGPGPRGPSPSGAGPAGAAATSSPSSASTPAEASDDHLTPDGRVREDARYYKLPPYPTAPADPWVGVHNDEPLRWSEDEARYWKVRATPGDCTAAADHCLLPHAWFVVRQDNLDRLDRGLMVGVTAHVFGPKGPAMPSNASIPHHGFENLVAFRTVPATKHNLKPGVLAIGLRRPATHPADGRDAVQTHWFIGEVEDVDLDIGTYKLKGYDDNMLLSGARVAVLKWREGGKVQILGGKQKHELAVRREDVFLPPK